ncbi:hypothetical protein DFH07DRAFT_764541 [Mycena maculata]|uniref:Uncharacterized protein n=1 Tax=Mycena maculata TaxID=230809 RepID=A0AAD7P072_9AGAR|nr:hypothetical protein DFH07DRAFT_764541 [Mycena maculata]
MLEISLLYCPQASDFSLDFSAIPVKKNISPILSKPQSVRTVFSSTLEALGFELSARPSSVCALEQHHTPCPGRMPDVWLFTCGKWYLFAVKAAAAEVEAEAEEVAVAAEEDSRGRG